MSESAKDALHELHKLETSLHFAYREEEDRAALGLIGEILAHKHANSARRSNKHDALANLTVKRIKIWRVKHGAPPIPGAVRIKIAADPAMAADLARVLGTEFVIPVNGDSLTVNTSTGMHPVNAFYLDQLPLNALESASIVAILKRHGVSSPSDVCKSLTTRLDGGLTLLECLKAQHQLPESLLPLCATIAQINDGTAECRTVYAISQSLEGTRVKLTCGRHTKIEYDDATRALVSMEFALFLAHTSKNASDELNFYQLMQNMQHLPAVDEMVRMIREQSSYLTAHFSPVVPWLKHALNLLTRDKKTAFVQSFLGQVSDTGAGSICKPYHFLRGNFMDCVDDAAKEHNGDGTAMMRAIIKMMDTRLKPDTYRVTETIDPATGAIKDKYKADVQAGIEIFAGVTNRFVSCEELGTDSVRFGATQSEDAGSVLAALLARGNGSKPGGGGSKPGLSASTFGCLGVSARKIFESLPGDSAGIDEIMKFLQENPSATVRVKLGSNQCLACVGTVKGEQVTLFKQPHMIAYYNRPATPAMFGIATQEWYEIISISRLRCNETWNYVFKPVRARHVGKVPNIMVTEYLVDTKQHELGPVLSALRSTLTMSTEAVVDPVIGFGVQTGTDPLKEGEKREWFAAHSVPVMEITLKGATRTYKILAPQ